MRFLKQSTSVDVGIGPFLDETDFKTAETALTITQPDVRLKKNNAAWAQKAAAQTLSHEENGWYEVTLDATDTDTIGILLLAVHESGALPVQCEFHVLAANVYDSLFGAATVKLKVDVDTVKTQTVTCAAGVTVGAFVGQATAALLVNASGHVTIGSAGLDSVVVETGLNARQALSLNAAALAGVVAGAGTTTITIKGAGVATTRITATADADGNRSALTLNPPA